MNRDLDFEIAFPVHLGYLGRIANDCGWSVQYVDMTLEEKEGKDSLRVLENYLDNPELRLIGISDHTVRTSVTTRVVANQIKNSRPDITIVVGGVNATFMWRDLLESCDSIDFVLRGYGQPGLRALLTAISSNETKPSVPIPGLAYREKEKFRVNSLSSVRDVDFLPPNIWDLQAQRYLPWTRTYPLLTHTGCGFTCNFCTSVMPGPYQRSEVYRPIADIIEEMSRAVSAGFDNFFMTANIFTSNRAFCLELSQAISTAADLSEATWSCMTRVEFAELDVLSALKEAGCTDIAFGLEIASQDQWNSLKKGRFSSDRIHHAFRLARELGIRTTAYLMIGAPTQTIEDIEVTVDLLRDLDPDYRVISFFQPFPGTPYWEDLDAFGLSEVSPLEDWNFHEAPICRTAQFNKAFLLSAAARLHLDTPNSPIGDLAHCSLAWEQMLDDLEEAPAPAFAAFSMISLNLSIEELLEKVADIFGFRGRLVALYALSAALRQGLIRVKELPRQASRSFV